MWAIQGPHRELVEALYDYNGVSAFGDTLVPWLAANPAEREWLHGLATRAGDPIPPATHIELCQLYSLSRVSQLLLLGMQPLRDQHPYAPPIALVEYVAFMQALGFVVAPARTGYTPIVHELVDVVAAADPRAEPTVTRERWPCMMLGDLVFSRAGVDVLAGSAHLDPELAMSSPLPHAWRRRNRPATDLSHGWGSNSQWATELRRDYIIRDRLLYNVDGDRDVFDERTEPPYGDSGPLECRIELARHRCFVQIDWAAAHPRYDTLYWHYRFSEASP